MAFNRLVVLALLASPAARANEGAIDCASDVATQQGINAALSLIDGQPTDPASPTVGIALQRASGSSSLQPSLQLAPGRKRGLCDAVLSVQLPAVEIASGRMQDGPVELGWEQRWHEDTGARPTWGSLVTLDLDRRRPLHNASGTALLVIAKTRDSGVYYINAGTAFTFSHASIAKLTPMLVLGGKWPAHGTRAWVSDIVFTQDAPTVLELGWQTDGPWDSAIGVGVSTTLQRRHAHTVNLLLQRGF